MYDTKDDTKCNTKFIIFYDSKREFYQKNPNNHVELYIGDVTNRYATFTGNTINNLPIKTKKPPGLTSGFIISMDF